MYPRSKRKISSDQKSVKDCSSRGSEVRKGTIRLNAGNKRRGVGKDESSLCTWPVPVLCPAVTPSPKRKYPKYTNAGPDPSLAARLFNKSLDSNDCER